MRSLFIFLASVLAALVLCLGSPAAAQPPPQVTGPITHVLTGLEQRAFLPADWTQEDFAAIAADEPAPDGHVWYVLQGNATNNGTEARSIDVNTIKILDTVGNEYSFEPQPKFIPDGMQPSYIDVPPGATAAAAPAAADDAATQSQQSVVRAQQAIEVPAHTVPMVEISDAGMGYRIRVPEGYETLRKGRFAHTFTLVLPGGAHEYNVNLSPLGVDDMEEAVSTATTAAYMASPAPARCGTRFALGHEDIAARKQELAVNTVNRLKTIVVDTDTELVYESEVMRRNEFHFVANVPVGGEPYYCEDSKRPFYTAAAIDVMRQACKTLAAR